MAKKYLCVNSETGKQFESTEAGLSALNKHVKHAKKVEVIKEIPSDDEKPNESKLTSFDKKVKESAERIGKHLQSEHDKSITADLSDLGGTGEPDQGSLDGGTEGDAGNTTGGGDSSEGTGSKGTNEETGGDTGSENASGDTGAGAGSDKENPKQETKSDESAGSKGKGKSAGKSGVFKD